MLNHLVTIPLLLTILLAHAVMAAPLDNTALQSLRGQILLNPRQVADQIHRARDSDRVPDVFLLTARLIEVAALIELGESESAQIVLSQIDDRQLLADDNANAEFTLYRASVSADLGDYKEAITQVNAAIPLALENRSGERIRRQALKLRGILQSRLNKPRAAMQDLTTAYNLSKQSGDELESAAILLSIGDLTSQVGDVKSAIDYYLRALGSLSAHPESFIMSAALLHLGNAYISNGDNENALTNLTKALKISERIGDRSSTAYARYHLTKVMHRDGNDAEMLQALKGTLTVFRETGNRRMEFLNLLDIAELSAKMDDRAVALGALDQARSISLEMGDVVAAEEFSYSSALIYARFGQYAKADEQLREYKDRVDRQHRLNLDEQLQELRVKFDTDQKDVENRLLQQQNRINQLEISEQTEIRNLYYTLALLALLIAALLFLHNQREKQSTNRMTQLAMTDELTGIPNRRQIFNIGAEELSRSHRYKHPLTIGVIDLDDFKKINDQYGHDVGDLVLIEFTRAISIALREQDKIGRIGGEEFLVVFPNTSAQELSGIMGRARQQVIESSLKLVKREITFCTGAAELIDSDLELKSILKRADLALYDAKESGKDRCLVASNSEDGTLVIEEVG